MYWRFGQSFGQNKKNFENKSWNYLGKQSGQTLKMDIKRKRSPSLRREVRDVLHFCTSLYLLTQLSCLLLTLIQGEGQPAMGSPTKEGMLVPLTLCFPWPSLHCSLMVFACEHADNHKVIGLSSCHHDIGNWHDSAFIFVFSHIYQYN